jgi:hypothetical protein
VGLNCALGASDMKKYIANLSACADCYVFCYPNAGLPNAMGGYDQKGAEMAEEVRPFFEEGLVNGVGGCCGTTPEHIAAIRAVASTYPPRPRHDVAPLMRVSGLEPFNYTPDAGNLRSTFINIGERCNVAGSIMFKKAIIDGDYDKALSIALKQVRRRVSAGWGLGAVGGAVGGGCMLACAAQRSLRMRSACAAAAGACASHALQPRARACACCCGGLPSADPMRPPPLPAPPPFRCSRARTCWTSTWTTA